jgi:hypothetical protein
MTLFFAIFVFAQILFAIIWSKSQVLHFVIFAIGLVAFLSITGLLVLYNLKLVNIDLYLFLALGTSVCAYILNYFISQIYG